MTAPRPQDQPENVIGGGVLALLALPVGVLLLVLLSSIGFIASLVGFVVAYAAVWLYRRGSGGRISRTGAYVVTSIVIVTLLFGIWVSLVFVEAGGLGHIDVLGNPRFWDLFSQHFSDIASRNLTFIVLILAFGALGAFRTLGRAFAIARATESPANLTGQPTTLPAAPQTFHDDIDAPPTGSADDKTVPPTVG